MPSREEIAATVTQELGIDVPENASDLVKIAPILMTALIDAKVELAEREQTHNKYSLSERGHTTGHWVCECGADLGDDPIDEIESIFAAHRRKLDSERRVKELSEALREVMKACAKFRQDRGRHEGEHDFSLTVCQSCNTAYVQAESVFDEQVERARAVLSEG